MLPILYVVVMIEFRFEYDFSLAESVKYYDENMEKHVISFRKVACAIREKIRCECAAPHAIVSKRHIGLAKATSYVALAHQFAAAHTKNTKIHA